jgi:hypothetical protein
VAVFVGRLAAKAATCDALEHVSSRGPSPSTSTLPVDAAAAAAATISEVSADEEDFVERDDDDDDDDDDEEAEVEDDLLLFTAAAAAFLPEAVLASAARLSAVAFTAACAPFPMRAKRSGE